MVQARAAQTDMNGQELDGRQLRVDLQEGKGGKGGKGAIRGTVGDVEGAMTTYKHTAEGRPYF